MKKRLVVVLSVVGSLTVGLVVGGAIAGNGLQTASSGNGWFAYAPNAGENSKSASDAVGGAAGGAMNSVTGSMAPERSVIQTANLTLETKELKSAIESARKTVAKFGGSVDNWSQQANDAGVIWNVSASLRIPADKLDAAIQELSTLGKVSGLDINNTDVTTQVLDINARVAALKTSVSRLEDLLAKAKSTADLLAAETALSQRQAELQSLEQQQKYLAEQVDMSTIWLQLYTEGLGPVSTPTSFIDGLNQGWKALVLFAVGLGVAAGWVVPWLLVFVPAAALVWLVIVRVRRARRA